MKNYTCLIIDDEILARSLLREYLGAFPQLTVLEECADGFEGIKSIAKHQPDFIFLDVHMPKINGFEMLELLDKAPAVIFTTAFDAYAMKAFENHAIDYLLKPFSKERFGKAIEKLMKQLAEGNPIAIPDSLQEEASEKPELLNRLVVKHHQSVLLLDLADVNYLEAYGDYVKIHCGNQVYLKKKTMQYLEDHLPAHDFIRVHRSYIIPSWGIQKLDPPDFVILRNGEKIPMSKSGYQKLKQRLEL